MAGLDSISVEEFRRVMIEAVLEGQRQANLGQGPSTGTATGGSQEIRDYSAAAKDVNQILKNMQKTIGDTNKGLASYQNFMKGQELAILNFGDALDDIDKEIARLTATANEADMAKAKELQAARDTARAQAIYKNNIAGATNVTLKMSQAISGTLLPGIFNVAKGLNDGADAADIGAASLNVAIDTFVKASEAVTHTMSEMGKGMTTMGGTTAKVGLAFTVLAPIIEKIIGAGAALAKEMIDISKTAYKRNTDMFNQLNASGAVFSDGLQGMRNAAYNAGMTTEAFSRTVQKNSATFAQAGIGVTEATQLMGGAMKAGGDSMRRDMLALGYNFEEQGELMAETMAMMRASGQALGPGDQAAIAQQTAKYAESLKIISAVTGEDARKKMQEAKDAAANLAFQQKLEGMEATQRQNVVAAMATMSEQQKKNFMETMVFGQVVNKAGAAMEASSVNFAQNNAELVRKALEGTLDAKSAAEINAKYAEGVRKDMLSNKEIAMAGMADIGGLGSELSKIMMNELTARRSMTEQAVQSAKDNIKAQQEAAKREGDPTAQIVDNMKVVNEILVRQQQITDGMADQFGDVVKSQMLPAVESLQKKIQNFKMSPEAITKAFEKAELSTEIVTGLTAVTALLVFLKGPLGRLLGMGGGGGGGGAGAGAGKALGGTVAGVGKGIGGAMQGMGQGIGGAMKGVAGGLASLANPAVLVGLGAVVLAIMGIATAARIAAPAFEPLGIMFKNTLEGLGTVVEKVLGGVSQTIEAIGSSISGIITSIGDSIANVVDKITKMRTAGTEATTEQIERLSKIPGDNMIGAAAGIDALKKALAGFDTGKKGFWGNLGDMITGGDKGGGFAGMLEKMAGAGERLVPVTQQLDMSKLKFDESLPKWYEELAKSVAKAAEAIEKVNAATAKPLSERLSEGASKVFGFVGGLFGSKEAQAAPAPQQAQAVAQYNRRPLEATRLNNIPPPPTGASLGADGEITGYSAQQADVVRQMIKDREIRKEQGTTGSGVSPQELTNELLRQVVELMKDSAGSQRILARNTF